MRSLETIENEMYEYYNKLNTLRKERMECILSNENWEEKCLHCEHRGYIYVRSQDVHDVITLQGFTFNYSLSQYNDNFHFKSDAWGEWVFNISDYNRMLNDKRIKEITKEEFLKEFNFAISEYSKDFVKRIKSHEKANAVN